MLDGIELKGRTNIVAHGITMEGVKSPLGLGEGSTENSEDPVRRLTWGLTSPKTDPCGVVLATCRLRVGRR